MKRPISVIVIVSIVGAALTVVVWAKADSLMDWAGDLLIIQDELQSSDIVFVPSGDPAHRLPKAVELLNAGLADQIVVNVERTSKNQRAFEKRYGSRFSNRALVDHILVVEKVDPAKVIIPEDHPRSTQDDFRLLNKIITERGARSIIVTTSWYHLRRCQMVAERILGCDITLYFVPAKMPDSDAFISKPKRAMSLFVSYLKLGYYYLTAW